MRLFLDRDFFNNPKSPEVYLCNASKKTIGELLASDLQGDFKWNTYSEISFVIRRTYTDILNGETVVNPLFDKIEPPRTIYLKNIGYFIIQDVDTTYGEADEAQVTAFSLEYSAGQKYLTNFKINKGDDDSKEVIYAADRYGADAQTKDMYKLANINLYDSNEQYFHRVYTDSRHYDYEPIEVTDENAYNTHFGEDIHPEDILYIHGWAPVVFYDPNTPELSLLNLVFNELPEWKIGHVDYVLKNKNRSFDESRVAIYDFIMQNVCETFKCVCEWDTINNEVNFYEEVDDGINDNNTVDTRYDTDVYISRDNLANEINISYSADDIKTRLKVSGADDLNIREINLGQDYIMNLEYYNNPDWMDADVLESYDDYLTAVKNNTDPYNKATQQWVAAKKESDELFNNVPVEGNVVLIDDTFAKLYCVYSPINTAYYMDEIQNDDIGTYISADDLYVDSEFVEPISTSLLSKDDILVVQGFSLTYKLIDDGYKFEITKQLSETTSKIALIKKLNLYTVDEDLIGSNNDNILLRLEDKNSNTATIRIYDPKRQADATYDENAEYYTRKENPSGSGKYTYTKVRIENVDEFKSHNSGSLFTNDYKIKITTYTNPE